MQYETTRTSAQEHNNTPRPRLTFPVAVMPFCVCRVCCCDSSILSCRIISYTKRRVSRECFALQASRSPPEAGAISHCCMKKQWRKRGHRMEKELLTKSENDITFRRFWGIGREASRAHSRPNGVLLQPSPAGQSRRVVVATKMSRIRVFDTTTKCGKQAWFGESWQPPNED